jgi:hypothetical protein
MIECSESLAFSVLAMYIYSVVDLDLREVLSDLLRSERGTLLNGVHYYTGQHHLEFRVLVLKFGHNDFAADTNHHRKKLTAFHTVASQADARANADHHLHNRHMAHRPHELKEKILHHPRNHATQFLRVSRHKPLQRDNSRRRFP